MAAFKDTRRAKTRSQWALVAVVVFAAAGESPGTPQATWLEPDPIVYGTALGPDHQNAVFTDPNSGAALTGAATYDPPLGTLLEAGVRTLGVTFVPDPGQGCPTTPVTATTTLTVNKRPLLAVFTLRTSLQYEPGAVFVGLVAEAAGLDGLMLNTQQFNDAVVNGQVVVQEMPIENSDLRDVFGPLGRFFEQQVVEDGVTNKVLSPLIFNLLLKNYEMETVVLEDKIDSVLDEIEDKMNDELDKWEDERGDTLKRGVAFIVEACDGFAIQQMREPANIRGIADLAAADRLKIWGVRPINPVLADALGLDVIRTPFGGTRKAVIVIEGDTPGTTDAAAVFDSPNWLNPGPEPGTITIDPKDAARFVLGGFGNGKSIRLEALIRQFAIRTDEDVPVDFGLTDLFSQEELDSSGETVTFSGLRDDFEVSDGGTPNDRKDDVVTYAPPQDFHGRDTITISIGDEAADEISRDVTITVEPINDPPTAVADRILIDGDGPIEFDPTRNDKDPDLEDFLILSDSFAPPLTRKEGTNTLVYDPPGRPTNDVSVSYTIEDSQGETDTSEITISVIDFRPVLGTGTVFIDTDNDRNTQRYPVDMLIPAQPDGGESVFIGDYMPATKRGGKFKIVGRGYFEYTPPSSFYGADVMTYTLETLSGQKGEVYVVFNKFKKNQPLQLHATNLNEKVFLCWPADPENRFVVSRDLQTWEAYEGNIGTFGSGRCLEKKIEPGKDYSFRIER